MMTAAMKLRHLLLAGKRKKKKRKPKNYDQPRQVLKSRGKKKKKKSRGSTLPTKFHMVKAMVYPAVTHGHESWT